MLALTNLLTISGPHSTGALHWGFADPINKGSEITGMTDYDIEFNFLPLIWKDRPAHKRHADACLLLARQLAFAAAGAAHQTYFKTHRAKLMTQASELIAARAGLAKWRLHRR